MYYSCANLVIILTIFYVYNIAYKKTTKSIVRNVYQKESNNKYNCIWFYSILSC